MQLKDWTDIRTAVAQVVDAGLSVSTGAVSLYKATGPMSVTEGEPILFCVTPEDSRQSKEFTLFTEAYEYFMRFI